jgi:exopolysaccharide biosynthesis polyprenyl glycosylphosphotransferase
MFLGEKGRRFILFIGDVICFYIALFLTAKIRNLEGEYFLIHLKLFSLIFFVWLIVFYIGRFYELEIFKERKQLWAIIFRLQIINILLAIIIFYFYPVITPKTNLFLIILFSTVLILLWRFFINSLFLKKIFYRVLLIGNSQEINELKNYISLEQFSGYRFGAQIKDFSATEKDLKELIKKENIKVIVSDNLLKEEKMRKFFIEEMFDEKEIYDTVEFYEKIFKHIPLSCIDENWFLNYLNIYRQQPKFLIKKIFDFILALIVFLISFIFWPFIILAIKINSPGPIFYKSTRVGKNGQLFKVYKFRSMYYLPENKNWSRWSSEKDSRITSVGNFLRKNHLDELPQLINILKGEMSFVGPRPMEKKLFDLCIDANPLYYLRNIVKPGLTGWAQLNYHYAACLDDELKKFEYDLYYLRNRSFWFDLAIILRTIKYF